MSVSNAQFDVLLVVCIVLLQIAKQNWSKKGLFLVVGEYYYYYYDDDDFILSACWGVFNNRSILLFLIVIEMIFMIFLFMIQDDNDEKTWNQILLVHFFWNHEKHDWSIDIINIAVDSFCFVLFGREKKN